MRTQLVAALVAGLAIGASGAAAQTPQTPPSTPQNPPASTPQAPRQPGSTSTPAAKGQDQQRTSEANQSAQAFMKKAAEAGKAEMELGALAQQKASDSKVKAYAEQLVKDHTQADSDLQQIAKTKSVSLPSMAPANAAAAKSKLEKLQGSAFDRAFIDQMIRDHTQAVKEFEQASKSSDSEVKSFADRTLPTLRDHLQRAQDLKKEVGSGAGK